MMYRKEAVNSGVDTKHLNWQHSTEKNSEIGALSQGAHSLTNYHLH
jgi:hypothetical protein